MQPLGKALRYGGMKNADGGSLKHGLGLMPLFPICAGIYISWLPSAST